MIQLIQIYDLGPSTEDRDIWVNPAHIMYVQHDDEPGVSRVTMADGWMFRCRHTPYFISKLAHDGPS